MKKLYTFIIIAASLLALASCEHKHIPVIEPGIPATCTEIGLTEGSYCAECGDIISAQTLIPKKGHTPVIDKAVAATCTTDGLSEGSHCSDCGTILVAQDPISQFGHTVAWRDTTEPTCSVEGRTPGEECIICGEIFSGREPIEKIPHTPTTISAVAPSCTEEGLTAGKECSVCHEVIVAQEPIPTVDHTPEVLPAVEPTCTAEGLTEGLECSVCHEIITEQEPTEKLEHTIASEDAVEPTCSSEGYTAGTFCAVCNTSISGREVIAALPHSEVVSEAVEPTCEEPGLTAGAYCSVCGEVTAVPSEIPPLGHTVVIDKGYAATYTSKGLSDGKHCSVCLKVLEAQNVLPILERIDLTFPLGTVTTEPTTVKTNHLELKIDTGVYVPGNLVEVLNIVTDAMETVSGMKFEGNPEYRRDFGLWNRETISELLIVEVEKSDIDAEFNNAHADADGVLISSGDIIDLYALIHECAHTLQYRQSKWYYCTWAMEAISNYTIYKTQQYIIENHPDIAEYVNSPVQTIRNMYVNDYSKLYEHSMEYWIDNTFEYAGNQNYTIGFRLAWFLDETYGDYTGWIFALEESYPFSQNSSDSNQLPNEKILEAFYLAYGENVFDDFYTWLKKNEERTNNESLTFDLRNADRMAVYPKVYWFGTEYKLSLLQSYDGNGILYRDLYISLEPGNQYLTEYKGRTYEKLTLTVNEGVTVQLFNKRGEIIRVTTGDAINLTGVSFVKLVGEGKLTRFEITGFTDPQ